MSTEYHNNHYVPVWYQKRFIPKEQADRELYYLDMKPPSFVDGRGRRHERTGLHRWGPKYCFAEKDLYTAHFGSAESTRIEEAFFGPVDQYGQKGVNYFTDFVHPSVEYDALTYMMLYMSTQKLRTPKGLGWLNSRFQGAGREEILSNVVRLRDIFSAIWMECVWQIADAEKSATKFIISDHPVTVYNRRCGPRSDWCKGYNDPDIRYQGTHTIFPLTLDKVLILTNSSWVRNPYQSEVGLRPNPIFAREAVFNYTDIQTLRHLHEKDVLQINFIVKSGALRYVAAGKKEWLYPDENVSKSQWHDFGDGYLLMPDPRAVDPAGEIFLGYDDGTVRAFDAYGRPPWDPEYKPASKNDRESDSLYRFRGEFARRYGPCRRGRAYGSATLDNERDTDEYHEYNLSLETKGKVKKG